MKKRVLALGVLLLCLAPLAAQDLSRKQSVWDTNFGVLTLVQEGPFVWGTYDYHGGKLVGALRDGRIYGYWWEDDDTVGAGPQGQWCGPCVWVMEAASFQGTYGKHSRGESTFKQIDPSRTWTGTKKSGSFDPFAR